MPRFLLLSGLPCSGKTAFRKNFLTENPDAAVMSEDDVLESTAKRLGISYQDLWLPEHEDHLIAARNVVRFRFQEAIKDERDIVCDKSLITFDERAKRLESVPDDYEKIGIAFETDLEILKERNAARKDEGRNIPDAVIDNMAKTYQQPHFDEGFDKIIVITNNETTTVL